MRLIGRFLVEQKLSPDIDLASPEDDAYLYVCGTVRFMKFIIDNSDRRGWPMDRICVEYFQGKLGNNAGDGFAVRAAHSEVTVEVRSGQTIAEAFGEQEFTCQRPVSRASAEPALAGVRRHS